MSRLESIICFLQQSIIPLWLHIVLALVPIGISIFVFCRQSALIKQQNKIALFEKRYELYVSWSQLFYGAQKLKNFITIYKANKSNPKEYYKVAFFLKAISMLFPKEEFALKIITREERLYNHVVDNNYHDRYDPPDKEFMFFYDHGAFDAESCQESLRNLYFNVTNDFSESIYRLKMITKLFKLKQDINEIFKIIKNIQKNMLSDNSDLNTLQNLFLELAEKIITSRIREEMFEQIEIVN